jgi:hypothetical protein
MGRNKNDDMVCDVCDRITGHMTMKRPPERPYDECPRCYWTRELNVAAEKARADGIEEIRAATSDQLNAALDRADDLSRTVAAMASAVAGST